MKISIAATNPCHLYDLARELNAAGALSRYYSGYPRWKLRAATCMPVVARSWRTLTTYGCLRFPHWLRPAPHRLFRWQDAGFDRDVARSLRGEGAAWLHGLPGQCLHTFRAARSQGIKTVLNHASGPVKQQLALVADEYRRANVPLDQHHGFDAAYFEREEAEYALADRHCVASSVVKRQLVAEGVPDAKIWLVPYGADQTVFYPPRADQNRDRTRVIFAGQLTLRKGLRVALPALARVRESSPIRLEMYGSMGADLRSTLAEFSSKPWISLHGAVGQNDLAEVFRHAGVLILPSWEEAFGLVVVQALSCGLPCVVSDRVGAADLIQHRHNGSVFPAGDGEALAREVAWWVTQPTHFDRPDYSWRHSASRLIALSAEALR